MKFFYLSWQKSGLCRLANDGCGGVARDLAAALVDARRGAVLLRQDVTVIEDGAGVVGGVTFTLDML